MNQRKLFYKGMRVNLLGLPIANTANKINEGSKRKYLISFVSDFSKDAPKNLLLIYDIPHDRKKDRDWFRRQLKGFGFIMIQKSVWVGPSPLPKEFLNYLKRIGLEKEWKTFKLTRAYNKSRK